MGAKITLENREHKKANLQFLGEPINLRGTGTPPFTPPPPPGKASQMGCSPIKPVTGACDRFYAKWSVSPVGCFVIKRSVQNKECHKCHLKDTPSHLVKALSKVDKEKRFH